MCFLFDSWLLWLNADQIKLREERIYFPNNSWSQVYHWEKARQELKTETKSEITKEYFLLLTPQGLFRYLSYVAQTHVPRNGIVHSDLGPPTSISNQDIPTGQSNGDNSLIKITS